VAWIKLPNGCWVTEPPKHCANGHSFTPGDIRTYHESWAGCWCTAAVAADDARPGHDVYECKTCQEVTTVPEVQRPRQAGRLRRL
jgi:hypothetical protein